MTYRPLIIRATHAPQMNPAHPNENPRKRNPHASQQNFHLKWCSRPGQDVQCPLNFSLPPTSEPQRGTFPPNPAQTYNCTFSTREKYDAAARTCSKGLFTRVMAPICTDSTGALPSLLFTFVAAFASTTTVTTTTTTRSSFGIFLSPFFFLSMVFFWPTVPNSKPARLNRQGAGRKRGG